MTKKTDKVVFDGNRRHDYQPLGEVAQTILAHYGTGGGNTPMVVDTECIGLDLFNQATTGGHVYKDNKTGTLRASMGDNQMSVCNEDSQGGQMLVRRLTPLECERLQGFPDNWTNIPEWTDTKGKKHKTADTPRYKALGNSIALPFWEWLAGRICDTLRAEGVDQPTMASLFDGIGGFPLVFSRCGCEPVWASEIEEFPIAVTKYHFPENNEEATTDDRQ